MRKSSKFIKLVTVLWLVAGDPAIAVAKDAKTIRLDDKSTATITISGRGTVLNMPTKPTKVVLGRANSFGIEYCDSDLIISPLSPTSRSNLFVYMLGRRFSFDLVTSMAEGSAVILVRDSHGGEAKVKIYD